MRGTHLYTYHLEHGKMVEFAGFTLPLYYTSIVEEHLAVREGVGVFDVSHMGRLQVKGRDATTLLERLVPSDIAALKDGRAKYTVLCNESGGIVDDIVLLKTTEERYLIVVNASNRDKDYGWLTRHAEGFDADVLDLSDTMPLISIQGPKAKKTLQSLTTINLEGLPRFSHTEGKIADFDSIISATGYTGEEGYEVFLPECTLDNPHKALEVWDKLLKAGAKPCGLGARDTLRLEAGMCLYGQDIDETTSPVEASLTWLIKKEKTDYIGSEAISRQIHDGVSRLRVCFILQEGMARHGCILLSEEGEAIGKVTSGSYSPTLRKGIGMGYVKTEYAKPEQEIYVDIRGRKRRAVIKKPPLFDSIKYGWTRRR